MGIFQRQDKKATDRKSAQTAQATEPQAAAPASMKELYGSSQGKAVSPAKKGEPARPAINASRILIKPLVTEKATNLGALNKYVFAVDAAANKIEVAKSVYAVYGIKPVGVRIVNVLGKTIRYGRVRGRRKNWKKAIITLPAGKTINIYEGV